MSNTALNPGDVDRLVLEAFTSGWLTYTPKGQFVFTDRDPERFDEKISVTASGGDIPVVAQGASFPQVDITEVGQKTFSQVDYKESLPITTLLRRFDNYGVVMEEASKQGYRARLTMDRVQANILNNAFTTSTVWDGLSIYNAAHQIGITGFTQSNIVVGPLGDNTLNNMEIALGLQNDQNNQVMALIPRTFVVPLALRKKAFELTASQGAPESANRNSNFHNTLGMEVVPWELLTSTTSCFLFSEKLFNRFRAFVSIPPTIEYVRIPSNGNYEYQLEFAMVAGAGDYLGTVAIQ
jgi:hypothetical protein